MQSSILIREATDSDRAFIFELSPKLAEVAKLSWHSEETVQEFQDEYISQMLGPGKGPQITMIAEENGSSLGFIHARETKDSISEEACGTIPLLAVAPLAQGRGVGQKLMESAESWSAKQGHRLLHLEVFANNRKAQHFYSNLGFQSETLVMVKPIS